MTVDGGRAEVGGTQSNRRDLPNPEFAGVKCLRRGVMTQSEANGSDYIGKKPCSHSDESCWWRCWRWLQLRCSQVPRRRRMLCLPDGKLLTTPTTLSPSLSCMRPTRSYMAPGAEI